VSALSLILRILGRPCDSDVFLVHLLFLTIRPPPCSTLFPYTTLFRSPKCAPQLPAPYDEVVGVRTVSPDQAAVLNPVPGEPEQVLPADQQLPLITLTTCHPEWSAWQRLIVHGLLTKQYQKLPDQPGLRPPELTENAVPER